MADLYTLISLDRIQPSPYNPRKTFDATALEELAQTIREHGVLEPAVVRRNLDGIGFELVMGERRLRASKLAGKEDLPCIVREYTDAQVLEVIVIENNQRADVNAAEESQGFAAILEVGEYKAMGKDLAVKTLARKLGRSESYVWQRLKLSSLTDEAKAELLAGEITPGHAIEIARCSPELQEELLTQMLYQTRYGTGGKEVRTERRETGNRISVRELRRMIGSRGGIRLEDAPFDLSYHPAGVGQDRPCVGCPFRSLTDPSADSTTVDACRDKGCFEAKCRAHVEDRVREVTAALGAEPVRITRYYRTDVLGIEGTGQYNVCGENDKGARASVVVDGNSRKELGALIWTKRVSTGGPSAAELERERQQREDRARKVAVETEIRKRILTELGSVLPQSPDVMFMRLIAKASREDAYASDALVMVEEAFALSNVPKRDKVKPDSFAPFSMPELVRMIVGFLVSNDLTLNYWDLESTSRCRPKTLEAVAELFGVDHERIRKEAKGQGKLFDAEKVPA